MYKRNESERSDVRGKMGCRGEEWEGEGVKYLY